MARLAVFGAGVVGCYLGGRLAMAGADLRFVGRRVIGDALESHGLTLTDYTGTELHLDADRIVFDSDARELGSADVVLVTVKCGGTPAAAAALEPVLRDGTLVISFQNGVRQADALRLALPRCTVLAGMVPFNVVARGGGVFHQGSGGQLVVDAAPKLDLVRDAFVACRLPLRECPDIVPVQWGKLLFNLNNAINALSGLTLREQLAQRDYRRCLALAQAEALRVLHRAGMRAERLAPVPVSWLPAVLNLPDAWFMRLARAMLAIDPLARSSMADDLAEHRATEVDWLNGEIVRLAAQVGLHAPVNARLAELVHHAERERGRPHWRGDALLNVLGEAGREPAAGADEA